MLTQKSDLLSPDYSLCLKETRDKLESEEAECAQEVIESSLESPEIQSRIAELTCNSGRSQTTGTEMGPSAPAN